MCLCLDRTRRKEHLNDAACMPSNPILVAGRCAVLARKTCGRQETTWWYVSLWPLVCFFLRRVSQPNWAEMDYVPKKKGWLYKWPISEQFDLRDFTARHVAR